MAKYALNFSYTATWAFTTPPIVVTAVISNPVSSGRWNTKKNRVIRTMNVNLTSDNDLYY